MQFYIIYGYARSEFRPQFDLSETYDFAMNSKCKKMEIIKRGYPATVDMASHRDRDIYEFDFGHISIESRIFKEWIGNLSIFSNAMYEKYQESERVKPLLGLIESLATLKHFCNGEVKMISDELTKWRDEAKKFNFPGFFGGYEHVQKAFDIAVENGGVWIKYM